MTRPGAGVPTVYLALCAGLYAVQGVVVAYLFNFNKPYMLARGVSTSTAGLVQTAALLPLALKFLVGPVSDRYSLLGRGHRLPYIVLGLFAQSAGLVGLAVIDPGPGLAGFVASAVLAVVGLAVYDTCCDGLVVDVTPPEGRSRVQGILWGSRFLAATVFTLAFGVWLSRLGGPRHADRLLYASAALTLVPAGLAVWLREPARGPDAERFAWSALRVMVRPWSIALLLFGGLYGLGGLAVESNVSLYYARLGLDPGGDVGLLGACRNLGRALGAALLPVAVLSLRRRSVLAAGVVGLAAAVAAHTLISGRPGAAALALAFGLAMGWDDTLFAALAMEASDRRLAASTFALFMAVTNLSVVGDALFSRGVAASGGFHMPLLAAALIVLVALPLAVPLGRPGPAAAGDAA
ncbi:MAG: MFS transporter [Isosphaeraceae bacterium]